MKRELDFLTLLSHPHIVKGHCWWMDADGIFLAQEFAALGDLGDVAARYEGKGIPESLVTFKARRASLVSSRPAGFAQAAPSAGKMVSSLASRVFFCWVGVVCPQL